MVASYLSYRIATDTAWDLVPGRVLAVSVGIVPGAADAYFDRHVMSYWEEEEPWERRALARAVVDRYKRLGGRGNWAYDLARLGPEAIIGLDLLVQHISPGDYFVEEALRGVQGIGARAEPARAAVLDVVRNGDQYEVVHAIGALRALRPMPEVVLPALEDAAMRWRVVRAEPPAVFSAFGDYGERAIPHLVAVLGAPDPVVREHSARLLQGLVRGGSSLSEEQVDEVEGLARRDGDSGVRLEALLLFGLVAPEERAVSVLEGRSAALRRRCGLRP